MKKITLLTIVCFTIYGYIYGQQRNHVFSGAEYVTFGEINLSAAEGKTWSTDRAAIPGYFSAEGVGTYTGAADGTNYIDGYVKYYGGNNAAASFTFPVGQNTDLRTLSIAAPSSTAKYATAWIVGDPSGDLDPTTTGASGGEHSINNVESPIGAVSNAGQWDWQDLSGDAAGKTVTVSIPDQSNFALVENLRLVGWNGTKWIDLSGGATASGNTENSTITGTMVDGVSAIGIGSTSVSLPAVFGKIHAGYKNGVFQVNWKTLSEESVREYVVEGSVNGTEWKKLGTIASKAKNGKSSVPIDYEFTVDVSALTTIMGMGLFMAFLWPVGFGKRKNKLLLSLICLFVFAGCSKKIEDAYELQNVPNLKYIRVAQYDFDGHFRYTKVVKVIAE